MNVRKSAARLSTVERGRFIAAVRELKNTFREGSPTSVYDQYVGAHLGVVTLAFDIADQETGDPVPGSASGPAAGVNGGLVGSAFLPWHREYLRRFELELQSIDSTVTLPYWDWTDHEDTENVLFQESFLGDRGAAGGGSVTTGPFRQDEWPVLQELHFDWGQDPPVTLGTDLVRGSNEGFDDLATPEDIRDVLRIKTYPEFRDTLEFGEKLHGYGHFWVGGSMGQMTSPNDPIFFMHHAMVDRIWDIWQRRRRIEWESDPANQGRTYRHGLHYAGVQEGHQLYDAMWPWDGGLSTPATVVLGTPDEETPEELRPFFVPDTITLPPTLAEIIRPADVLASASLGIAYDNPTQFD